MENLLLWGFYLLTFYAFLPGFISRTFGFRVFKKGRAEQEIALTFDDGPDPVYTPMLLDLLQRFDAKATFFVVGANAERHPELLKRMKDEGHIVGIHNYVHKTNWLMRPSTVKKQIERTSEIIEAATGERPIYYRPPWGIVNLFDFSNMGYLQIILWSGMFGDWRNRVGAERLTKRMMKKLRPGEVLLLHDCGTTFGADHNAPVQMLAALEAYMTAGRERGYRFVAIDQLIALTDNACDKAVKREAAVSGKAKISMWKRAAISLWIGWEKCFRVMFKVERIGTGDSIFHYRICPYHGEPLKLADGRIIRNNDRVIELHFDNRKLLHVMMNSRSVLQSAIQLIREVEHSLPKLAVHMAGRKEFEGVSGLYGVSMIHRGSESFGFSVLDLPKGLFNLLTRFYLRLLLRVLHPGGGKRVTSKKGTLIPRIIAMSMDEFHKRYDPPTTPDRHWTRPPVELAPKPIRAYEADKAAGEVTP
ncbi:polysaccharide deacetylase family protein [Paenibacillus sambharensis]|uniref:Polysaccharide deacetylase family protein n=1 Tax=Paenibacillus sambharensis TaxID=1803190 RepID=A0A2W1LRV3_9BACL|nr:polysaccharide deacetylase family protein [Paenibacillus sambharensis]PZD94177.1 polysaccharide deacetylase family protein [Paenibacillus sambharensis]